MQPAAAFLSQEPEPGDAGYRHAMLCTVPGRAGSSLRAGARADFFAVLGGAASPGTGVFVPGSSHKTRLVNGRCWLLRSGQAALLLGQLETGAAGLLCY